MGFNSIDGYPSGEDRDPRQRNGSKSTSDKPIYSLDHLATMKMNRETGISSPIDGMKRLLEMNKTTGIWPQKMQICFDDQWVLILDYETKNVIEGFPGALIHEPTAFISNDPMEIYNNILVFVVGGSMSHTEMHIFQSTTISAMLLVDDLKSIRSGKLVAKRHEIIPITPTRATPNHQFRDQYGLREMNTISKDTFEKDMMLLNSCLEDIEKFAARLHSAHDATRELNASNGASSHGDGLLRSRSKLMPTETELLDILGKYKLAFNLINKLKSEIDDQGVPIHCLFISLELVVEVCMDVTNTEHLPAQVVFPLFTKSTIVMLNTFVTENERHLWATLGDCWNVPKDEWVGPVDAYQPMFFNGWSPKPSETDSLGPRTPIMQRTSSMTSNTSVWLRRLESRNVDIAAAIHDHHANNDKELNVQQGEYLEVLDDSRKWWRVRNHRGQVGYAPHTILAKYHYEGRHAMQSQKSVQIEPVRDPRASAMEDIQAAVLIKKAAMDRQAEAERQAMEAQRKSATQRSISMPNVPPPPPPPPPSSTPTTPTGTLQRNAELSIYAASTLPNPTRKKEENDIPDRPADEVHEELKQVLILRERRKDLEIIKTPQIYIEQDSSPQEVETWLKGKGFEEKIVNRLQGLNGKELFALPPPTIEEYFGVKEGRRLVSQIILQKNFSGYKTARSSELQAILARQKARQNDKEQDIENEVF